MYRFCLFSACLALAALATGCSSSAPVAADTRDADIQAVKTVEAAWVKDAATKDPNAWAKYYSDDAVLLMPNFAPIRGKEAIGAALKPLMADPNFSLNFGPATTVEASRGGDLVYTVGAYTMTVSDAKGKPMTDKGKYLTVYRKQSDGSWKAVADMNNTDLPAPK